MLPPEAKAARDVLSRGPLSTYASLRILVPRNSSHKKTPSARDRRKLANCQGAVIEACKENEHKLSIGFDGMRERTEKAVRRGTAK